LSFFSFNWKVISLCIAGTASLLCLIKTSILRVEDQSLLCYLEARMLMLLSYDETSEQNSSLWCSSYCFDLSNKMLHLFIKIDLSLYDWILISVHDGGYQPRSLTLDQNITLIDLWCDVTLQVALHLHPWRTEEDLYYQQICLQ
jgi:hypothetical protein